MRALIVRRLALLLPLLAGCLVLGCAGQARPPTLPSSAQSQARSAGRATLEDRGWGVLRSSAHGLKLALPEARAWLSPQSSAPGAASWELRHEPTGSTLSVMRWRASRLPRIDVCELELRQRTPGLPEVDETNLVARRDVRVPEGFVTRLWLLALPGKSGQFRGQVLAVGAGIGECLAAIASTDCSTEAELAERLRLLDVALGHLRLSHVEDRVPARTPPSR